MGCGRRGGAGDGEEGAAADAARAAGAAAGARSSRWPHPEKEETVGKRGGRAYRAEVQRGVLDPVSPERAASARFDLSAARALGGQALQALQRAG